jgi:hypothetical protein
MLKSVDMFHNHEVFFYHTHVYPSALSQNLKLETHRDMFQQKLSFDSDLLKTKLEGFS